MSESEDEDSKSSLIDSRRDSKLEAELNFIAPTEEALSELDEVKRPDAKKVDVEEPWIFTYFVLFCFSFSDAL